MAPSSDFDRTFKAERAPTDTGSVQSRNGVLDRHGRLRTRATTKRSAQRAGSDVARPVLAAALPPDGQSTVGVLAHREDATAVAAAIAACRQALTSPHATIEDMLAAARDALGAERVFLLSARPDVCGASVEVLSSLGEPAPASLAPGLLTELLERAERGTGRAGLKRLAVALGLRGGAVSAGFAASGDRHEALVAEWDGGAGLDTASMNAVAEAVTTSRTALAGIRAATGKLTRERQALAVYLHDDLIQTLTGAVLELDSLRGRVEDDPEDALDTLDQYRTEMRRVLADTRSIVARMADGEAGMDAPEDEGSEPERLDAYVERVVKRWGLPARVSIEGDLDRVPGPVVSMAYSVIGEAMTNAAKHASTKDVTVRLAATESDLTVSITDRGRGFSPDERASAARAHHVGLAMLQRRVRQIGGKLYIESKPGHGTRIVARLPIDEVAS